MSDAAKQPTWHLSEKMRSRARSLRRDSTNAEQLIWNALRAHRLNGASFRRQTPIGPYIADFVCHAAGLIVELDGGQHFESENIKRDARRDAFLNSKGYRVLRFNNHDVMTNRQGVLETIAAALVAAPSPTLPRKRGREQSGASRSGGEQK
jgi:very-short-patch-repair endonuclease